MKGRVTPARRRALEVLCVGRTARVGVGMYTQDPEEDPVVTPAGESWLLDMGYALRVGAALVVTHAGDDAWAALSDPGAAS